MRQFRNLHGLILAVMLFLMTSVTLAQPGDTCPVIVHQALELTDEQCSDIGRNQACYGNISLEAIPQANVSEFKFDTPGDVEPVDTIDRLNLSSQIMETGEWGVVMMRLQANLPDTLPGQNITFLLFGDVQLQNRVADSPDPATLPLTLSSDLTLYNTPARAEPLVDLAAGEVVTVIGRDAEGLWLQVALNDDTRGWLERELAGLDADVETLQIKGMDGLPFRPMQAFYFQSGIGAAPCVEAPESGVLVQTPQGAEQVFFNVNGADISVGSTLYLQAEAPGTMTIAVVEGQATVEVDDVAVVVPQGSEVSVTLNDQGQAFGPPGEPEPYDPAKMAALPTDLLGDEITVAAPATDESITEALEAGAPDDAIRININNQPDWVDSGFTVSAGQTFSVTAHGRMNPCSDTYPNGAPYCIFFAPRGTTATVQGHNEFGEFPGLGHGFMTLLGRIGDGAVFTIGAGGSFTAEQDGTLWLTPNDNTRTDNQGNYNILIWPGGE